MRTHRKIEVKFSLKDVLRPEVSNFQPYIPGKPMAELQRELGLRRIIKLASNENPWGTSRRVKKAITLTSGEINRYPESSCPLLRQALAKFLKVSPQRFIFGAGVDELIELLGKTFLSPGNQILLFQPTFIRYQMAAELLGAEVRSVPLRNFQYDLSALKQKINKYTKMIFLANPNNPTGSYIRSRDLIPFLHQIPSSVLAVVDEAYLEYALAEPDYPRLIPRMDDLPNLILLRTFSKAYGLAGLRVGYGIAQPEIIAALERIRPPFNVNMVGQVAAVAALADQQFIRSSVQANRRGKIYLANELENRGVTVIPSAANFLLIKVAPYSGKTIFQRLLTRGVIVRPLDEYGLPEYIRVSIGKPDENCFFISQFRKMWRNG